MEIGAGFCGDAAVGHQGGGTIRRRCKGDDKEDAGKSLRVFWEEGALGFVEAIRRRCYGKHKVIPAFFHV